MHTGVVVGMSYTGLTHALQGLTESYMDDTTTHLLQDLAESYVDDVTMHAHKDVAELYMDDVIHTSCGSCVALQNLWGPLGTSASWFVCTCMTPRTTYVAEIITVTPPFNLSFRIYCHISTTPQF